jgi:hypothetical protein
MALLRFEVPVADFFQRRVVEALAPSEKHSIPPES